ncbi:GNAT family N-acetyltransferase [Bradyrhizobium sp. HKCCYLRH3061]|uniref:GNAT family N-acetyltransferase n=1 Tax=Bradyrhizobium sp. HKCCYLRH3061 TaxID=3420734 RepID=UPI003EB6C8AB
MTTMVLIPAKDDERWASVRTFIVAHGRNNLGVGAVWIADNLIPEGGFLLALSDRGRWVAVGTIIEVCDTALNSAELLVLAVGPGENAAAALLEMVSEGERLANDGPRAALEIALTSDLASAEADLRDRGYRGGYSVFELRRPSTDMTSADISGYEVRDLSTGDVPSFYRVVREAFAGIPGVSIPNFATFGNTNLAHDPPARLFFDGNHLAGFVRVSRGTAGVGRIELLGRNPAYRGTGLGLQLLREGVACLRAVGSREVSLQVSGASERALSLYRQQGFRLVRETPVLLRMLDC